jgi:thiol-disulfide isomerase/thioredoxin
MRNYLYFIALLLLVTSCKQKDYVTFDIKLDGLKPQDSILTIVDFSRKDNDKVIKINKEGRFKDTMKLKEGGFYGILIERAQIQAFLRNGFNLKLTGNIEKIDSTLLFKGKGSHNSNYLLDRVNTLKGFAKEQEQLFAAKDTIEFNKGLDAFNTKMKGLLKNYKSLDTMLVRFEKEGLEGYAKGLKSNFLKMYEMNKMFAKGSPSPKFTNYENYKGGKTSLDDFKGKFVYIDVWATWCQPCVAQIPALKELEEEYGGKNIEFVSISTDRKEDYNAWKEMVKEKDMKGVQLYFNDDMEFAKAYNINSIPRFIFVDNNGNIVNANAPRPSDKEGIKKMFSEVGL